MSRYHRAGDPECVHGFPLRALISGLPACPICRRIHRREQRRKDAARNTNPAQTTDAAALAAHDSSLFGEDSPA